MFKKKSSIAILLSLYLSASFNNIPSIARAQERGSASAPLSEEVLTAHWWESPFSGVRILIPASLIDDLVSDSLQQRHPQVVLALRNELEIEGQYFPTVTVTSHPRILPPSTSYANSILEDYHRLGMSDAVINRSLLLKSRNNGGPLPLVEISYTRGGKGFFSSVVGIPAEEGHELITITDSSTTFVNMLKFRTELLSSITLPEVQMRDKSLVPLDSKDLPLPNTESTLPMTMKLGLFIGVILSVVGITLFRSRYKKEL